MAATATTPRKVLMLAYVFPPFHSVGGSIRAVKFAKYLPERGWLPVVLTIDDSRETDTQRKQGSEALLQELPEAVRIYRTGAGEPSAEFLEKGRAARRKNRLMAAAINVLSRARGWVSRHLMLPDEHIAWLPFALREGRKVVREEGVDVIFATCPPHSATVIAALMKRLTGKPLVLDYRDDWIDTPRHNAKPWLARQYERLLERWAVATADRVVLVTEWSRRAFVKRYPRQPESKFVLIPNGVDLEQFVKASRERHAGDGRFTIVHAGLLSVADDWKRSPESFFTAIQKLVAADPTMAGRLRVAFTGRLPDRFRQLVAEMGLTGVIEDTGHLSQPDFLALMADADLLLAINYDEFATLIPGKIYEYWAMGGAPVLLLSCQGAASDLIARHDIGLTAPMHDVDAIAAAVRQVYDRWQAGDPWRIEATGVEQYDRKALTDRLAATLAKVAG